VGAAGVLAFSDLPAQSVPEAPVVAMADAPGQETSLAFPSVTQGSPGVRLDGLRGVREAKVTTSAGMRTAPRSGRAQVVRSLVGRPWKRLNDSGSPVRFRLSGYRIVNRGRVDQWRPSRLVLRGSFRWDMPGRLVFTDPDRDGLWRGNLRLDYGL